MVRVTQQQLSSSTAGADSWLPLTSLLGSAQNLLCCWHELVEQVPMLLQVVVPTLLPLVQQVQGCSSLLMRAAAAAAAHSAPTAGVQAGSCSSSRSCNQLRRAMFGMQQAASTLVAWISGLEQDAGFAAQVLRLQNDPAVAEMQLQLLTAWTAQLHKQHTAQQLQQQQLPPGTAGASSSSSSVPKQPSKQQHCADLLPIPAFHQDMLQLLPGGQAYLDVAAEEAAAWRLSGKANTLHVQSYACNCCHTISRYLYSHLDSIEGQQQLSRDAVVVSGAAVRLVLELHLLSFGVVQRQREQHWQQQQQQQQASIPDDGAITSYFALRAWTLFRLQIKALAATSRSCLPPEVLQQAGLQLLQALAAPLQQWQLSRTGDSFSHKATVTGLVPRFGDTLHLLVAAAYGAEPTHSEAPMGEHDQWLTGVCLPQPLLLQITWHSALLDVRESCYYKHGYSLHITHTFICTQSCWTCMLPA
jgi:hypothetical protein